MSACVLSSGVSNEPRKNGCLASTSFVVQFSQCALPHASYEFDFSHSNFCASIVLRLLFSGVFRDHCHAAFHAAFRRRLALQVGDRWFTM